MAKIKIKTIPKPTNKIIIEEKLKLTWSSQQIAAKMKKENNNFPCLKQFIIDYYTQGLTKIKASNLRL